MGNSYETADPIVDTEMLYRMAQVAPMTGDIEGNTEMLRDEIDAASEDGVDLVVFPEMAVTGYCVGDLIEDDEFVAANHEAVEELAEYTDDTAAVVGFIDEDEDGDLYNAAAVLQHGEVQGVAHKQLLPTYRYFDDERYFEAGDGGEPITVETDEGDLDLGVVVCEDLWDEEYDRSPATELADAGADLLVGLNASPYETGKREDRQEVLQARFEETGLPILYTNTFGVADTEKNVLLFDGESQAYGADGELVAVGETFDTDRVDTDLTGDADLPEYDRAEELFEALSAALGDYADKTGFTEIIEPISGGIDSSVGTAIAADAVGPENVHAYSMPSTVSSDETRDAARAVSENLGVEFTELPIQDIVDETTDTFEQHAHDIEDPVTHENVQARVRGTLAMLDANDRDALLVSNGNETELALGYATLYGDMTGGLALLGDCSKQDVYALAEHINDRAEEDIIPQHVIDAQPSAELAEGQEDPFDYGVVSPVVTAFLEERRSASDLITAYEDGELDPDRFRSSDGGSVYEAYDREEFAEIVRDAYRRFTGSAFKRAQAPPVIAVSERAFGTDFREPIINGWDGS